MESDAAHIWSLVESTPALDGNSPYAYLLLCSHFARTSVVAEEPARGDLLGFVVGYRPPEDPAALFVWQVGVASRARGQGIALAMLDGLFAAQRADGVRYLRATITPSNQPSRALFRAFARRNDGEWTESLAYPAARFPGGTHEDEIGVRIGPIDPERKEE